MRNKDLLNKLWNYITENINFIRHELLQVENLKIIIGVLLVIIILFKLKNLYLRGLLLEKTIENENATKNEISAKWELEKNKIENLKFTLNPHSFKNTLQVIESLAEKTYESVESLSGIFDYMLYDAKDQFVPLDSEVDFAIKYLDLYRLRLKPTVNVNKSINQDHLNEWGERKEIAPLVFAHFIENSFKHGELSSSKAFIQITIDTIDKNTLIYSVRNQISDKLSKKKGGLGNSTFKDRLDLLYKNNHEYDYSINDNIFTANLKLTIYDS